MPVFVQRVLVGVGGFVRVCVLTILALIAVAILAVIGILTFTWHFFHEIRSERV